MEQIERLPGVSPGAASDALRAVALAATNLIGSVAGETSAAVEGRYLRWAENAEMQLRSVVRAADVRRLILTERHWELRRLTAAAARYIPAVLSELESRNHALLEAADAVSADPVLRAPVVGDGGSAKTKGVAVGAVSAPDPSVVFVIHGRDERARKGMFDFLRALGLRPIEWSKAIAMTEKASPYIGDVLDAAFGAARAVVVLQTPDDIAYLHPSLTSEGDPDSLPQPQPRPNVLFEAGMAMGRDADRTVLVELGRVRGFSDVHGRHTVRMDGSVEKRQELAQRLKTAGCKVDLEGVDWHTAGDLVPPAGDGKRLPPGGKLLAAQRAALPELDVNYISNGGTRLDEIELINRGPGDLYELSVVVEQKEGLSVRMNALPSKLPAGKRVRPALVKFYGGGDGFFNVFVTGATIDQTPIEQEIFVSII